MLLRTEKIAGTSYLKVAQCNLKACTKGGKLAYCDKSFACDVRKRLALSEREVGIRLSFTSTNAAAYLVKLGEAHSVGIFDYQRVCRGEVNTGFDNGGRHKNIYLCLDKCLPDILDLILVHSSVSHGNARIGQRLHYPGSNHIDVLDLVIDVEHLTASCKLAAHRVIDDRLVIFKHVGLHRSALAGCFIEYRHIADSVHRHIKRTRNGGCRQGKNVNVLRHLL